MKLPKLLCQIAFHGLILATWPMQSFKIMSIDFLSLEVIHLRHPQKMTKLVISLSPSEKRAINILFKKTESAKRCQVSRPSPIPVPFGSHKCMVLYWNVFFISTEQCWERKTCQRVCNICFTGLLQTKGISHKTGFGLFAWTSFQENPRKKIYAHALIRVALREKCFYSEFFWSVFSRIWAEYGPEKFRIRTLFMQCSIYYQHLSKE